MKVIELSARRAKVKDSEQQFRNRQAAAAVVSPQPADDSSKEEYTPYPTTLLSLVTSLQDDGRSDNEVVALVCNLVNSGRVRLCGNFAGRDIDLDEIFVPSAAAAVGYPN